MCAEYHSVFLCVLVGGFDKVDRSAGGIDDAIAPNDGFVDDLGTWEALEDGQLAGRACALQTASAP